MEEHRDEEQLYDDTQGPFASTIALSPPLSSPPPPVDGEEKAELIHIAQLFKDHPTMLFASQHSQHLEAIIKLVSNLEQVLELFLVRGKYKCVEGRTEIFIYDKSGKLVNDTDERATKSINFSGKNTLGKTIGGKDIVMSWLDRKYPNSLTF